MEPLISRPRTVRSETMRVPSLRTDRIGHLERCVVLLSILAQYCPDAIRNHALVLRRPVPDGKVHVLAMIDLLDHERDDLDQLPLSPNQHAGVVASCADFRSFVSQLDECAVWKESADDLGRRLAVRIGLF